MATPHPQPPPSTQEPPGSRLKHYISWGCVIACPVIALAPPRKLDWYTFGLGVIFYMSADHLISTRNTSGSGGGGLLSAFQGSGVGGGGMPTERAREVQRALEAKRRKELAERGIVVEEKKEKRGLLKRIWMGGEGEDWKEKRMREEREAVEQGKGYGSMILGQIWEVVSWERKEEGKEKRGEEGKEKDK